MTQPTLTDRDVKAMFAARAAGTVNPDLAQRIHAAAATTRQRRRLFRFAALDGGPMRTFAFATVLGATTLALAGVLILSGGQDDAPVATPPPSAAPAATPTATPTASPTPIPSATPTPLPSGTRTSPATLERPRVNGLGWLAVPSVTLYAAASESSQSLAELPSVGTDLFFLEGPVEAEGYVWWKVRPYAIDAPPANTYAIGWVRAGVIASDEPPVLGYVPDCPVGETELPDAIAAQPYQAIACFGSDDIVVTGLLACSEADVETPSDGPSWMSADRWCTFETAEGAPTLAVYGEVVFDLVTPGQVTRGTFRVTGHVDDPEASACDFSGVEGGPSPEQSVLGCRTLFVATAVERLD